MCSYDEKMALLLKVSDHDCSCDADNAGVIVNPKGEMKGA